MDLLTNAITWWTLLAASAAAVCIMIYRRMERGTDIKSPSLSTSLRWDSQAATEQSVATICDYALSCCSGAITWYQRRRQTKRSAGFLLRIGALVTTAGAGLVPLSESLGATPIPAVVSTLLIALAGIFVSIDSLGGFTSGWVRYMLAQQKIERLRDTFLMDWHGLLIGGATALILIERAKVLMTAVGKVVDDETQEWATEFQSALKELERVRKTDSETARTGAIEVSLKNPQMVTSWTLEIDGNQRGRTSSKTLAVTDIPVGIRRARAYGPDTEGRILSDERVVKIEGGTSITRELDLS